MQALSSQSIVRFGVYELDLRARELYRGGVKIRLAPQPFDLLVAFIEQPGAVLTREALQQRLWSPDTFVDFEHGLNKTVRKLREALNDSAEAPRYIETVQKSGYRFIAPVTRPEPPQQDPPPASPANDRKFPTAPLLVAAPPSARPVRRWLRPAAIGLAAAAVLAVVTAAVVRHSASHRSTSTAAGNIDTRAQDAYMHGRYLWFGGHPLAASDYFKRAIALQPDYGPAWAGMSIYYGTVMISGRLDPSEGLDLQQQAAAQALRFAPETTDAHLAACAAIFLRTWRIQEANPECDRAVQADPNNAEAYHFQSKMLAAVHREDDALRIQRISSRLDPLSKPWELSLALMQARRYDDAFAEGRARLEAFPHDPRLLRQLSYVSLYRGNAAQYADFLEESYRSDGDEPAAAQIHEAYRSGGVRAIAQWNLRRLQQQSRTAYVSPFRLALAHIAVGDRQQAIDMLNLALQHHAPDLLWVRCYREFDTLAPDRRYQQILQQLPRP